MLINHQYDNYLSNVKVGTFKWFLECGNGYTIVIATTEEEKKVQRVKVSNQSTNNSKVHLMDGQYYDPI